MIGGSEYQPRWNIARTAPKPNCVSTPSRTLSTTHITMAVKTIIKSKTTGILDNVLK
jgi:hypothetical protein